ncbi:MAG: hypothetical protein COZ75_10930 [Flavobacteriaceae bacterium CG_4_8_14_3_um_filter_34_10]|nr:hypothetical protein [Flavobacteriia bacterium]OIP50757.1 MAG: hypothetical protein AUK33_06540 [Flavobacteriaceae bacterium CG2_30_34_30]PIQ19386.1 MAG: hypothetical protein COW66_01420 [Flavobacteriaceae bacterium CG18_big_fil_WC_8_21_14_2_50_34_36]PIV50368.1 MAG: hypothetical protein COS19_04125 [Flavobacteriaceae bacterium CG02_land_8_20_14_3_00_34_13]PIX08657.1 MAG: hypothetical protein COZ75_10930 [Flavobacteriaceae bacterium CG_4_8_14_3_um_filter_34_10]PIZ08011.1 MAG: hypothetical pr
MKNLILILSIAMLLFACKDNPVVKKAKKAKENVTNTQKVIKESTKMQDDIKELSEATPLTNDEMKTWLPDDVDGMKRTAFKTGAMGMMNIASVEATYATEDKSRTFKVEVIDGAGEMGALSTAGLRMAFSMDFEEETESKTRKTVTKKGVKAIEEYDKRRNQSVIQFMQDNRFYIKATGTNMEMNELWDLIDKMNVDDLV